MHDKIIKNYIKEFNEKNIKDKDELYIELSKFYVFYKSKKTVKRKEIIFPIYSVPDENKEEIMAGLGTYVGKSIGDSSILFLSPRFSNITVYDDKKKERVNIDNLISFYCFNPWGEVIVKFFSLQKKNRTYKICEKLDIFEDELSSDMAFNIYNKNEEIKDFLIEIFLFYYRKEVTNEMIKNTVIA